MRIKRSVYFFLLFILIAINLHSAFAQERDFDYLISNSEDWRDVYSVVHFGNLAGVQSDFLVSTRHGPILASGLNHDLNLRIISVRNKQFTLNYPNYLESQGFSDVDEVTLENANLELINDLPEINNFIIVGNTYGYNAIAVAPYAVHDDAWVFFADRTNIADIESILEGRDVNEIIIYGHVDREVTEALEQYDPEIIDNGDRFQDNIDIVEKYLEINPTQQVALSNGEFIEKGLMTGFDPILFTGKENVPEQISEYLKSSEFTVGVLVGSDLVGAATNIRRSTGLSVIVKFARGARNPTGPIASVEGLDLFYLPVPVLDLSVYSAKYNRATSNLEITYRSESSVPVYFKGTLTPRDENGVGARFGDTDAIFIAPNDYKTVLYSDVDLSGDDLSVDIFTLYGDTPSSMDRVFEGNVDISIINVLDSCEIDVKKVTYSKPKGGFVVNIKNTADVDCWADVEMNELLIDGEPTTIGSEGSIQIPSGKKRNIFIEQELTDEDLEDNSFVDLIVYYGEKEDSLVKVFQGRFEFGIQSISMLTVLIIAIIILLIIALIVVFFLRRRNEDNW